MDCTGLSYQKVRSNTNAVSGRPVEASSGGDHRIAGRNRYDESSIGDGDNDEKPFFHAHLQYSHQYMLLFEPAIHQLLEYSNSGDELINRHVVTSQELRQLILAELRKYSIVMKVPMTVVMFY